MYYVSKESKYAAVFLLTNNEAKRVPLLCLPSRYMISFILDKVSFEEIPLNLGS